MTGRILLAGSAPDWPPVGADPASKIRPSHYYSTQIIFINIL